MSFLEQETNISDLYLTNSYLMMEFNFNFSEVKI